MITADKPILVTGATGFIGRALVPALRAEGRTVIAASRKPRSNDPSGILWRTCDLLRPDTLPTALAGVHTVYYLVHSMGVAGTEFRQLERRAAEAFVAAASAAGVERIIYLGGPQPRGKPSEHLRSRLEVGEILRAGPVTTIELRASMVIGSGSASWRIVRDLAMRLPAMVLPRWLKSRTRPVALSDAIAALIGAADLPVEESVWFDIPGPEVISGEQILARIAELQGRRWIAVGVPLLTPHLSALWLKLVTRADYRLARELALGLREDLLPASDEYWALIGHTELTSFDGAARLALADEPRADGLRDKIARLEERMVERVTTRRAS